MSLQSSPSFLERVSVNFPGIKLVWTVFGDENEKLNICRQVLTSSTQLKTGHFTSLIGRERLRNIREFKEMTTATATTTLQINDLIGWTRKNNRAARAARFLVQFFDVDSKFSYLRFWRQHEPAAANLSFYDFAWKPFVPSKRKCSSPIV